MQIEWGAALLQGNIKSSVKRNLREPVARVFRHLLSFPSSCRPSYMRGANLRDCLPLKGIMTVFCLIFRSTPEAGERRREVEYLSSAREKKGRSKDRYASRVTEIQDAATEAVFGNSDDVLRDSCFEMSAANSFRAAIRLARVSPFLIAG